MRAKYSEFLLVTLSIAGWKCKRVSQTRILVLERWESCTRM